MKTRRSSLSTLEKKALQFKFAEEIPCDATCYSLGINSKLACPTCVSKVEHKFNLTEGMCDHILNPLATFFIFVIKH